MQEVISEKQCLHCSSLIPHNVSGDFCCIGCETAHKYINNLSLGKYYDYCRNIYNTKPQKVTEFEDNLVYEEYVENTEDNLEVSLLIEGIVCGSCIWLIENTLEKLFPKVSARVNLSTSRLKIIWQGKKSEVNKYIEAIKNIGFTPYPFDSKLQKSQTELQQKSLLKSIAIAGIASTNVMAFSLASWLGEFSDSIEFSTKSMFNIISMIIAVPLITIAGRHFFSSSIQALRKLKFNMDVPIAIAIILTLIISISNTLSGDLLTYYEAASMLTFILLIGRYIELKSRMYAFGKIRDIALKQPNSVKVIKNNKTLLIDVKNAKIGDIIIVNQGDKIALDGVIAKGNTQIDTSIITGESNYKDVEIGDNVHSGSVNMGMPIQVKVTASYKNSSLQQVINLVENTGKNQGKFQRISDVASKIYAPLVITFAVMNFVLWFFFIDASFNKALNNAIALLIITCPCALGISVPIAQIIANTTLLKQKIFIKSSEALEKITKINQVIFDKTGTLTKGKMKWLNADDFSKNEIKIIASMANFSSHPLCKAMVNAHEGELISDIKVEEKLGQGLKAVYKNKTYKLGNACFCNASNSSNDEHTEVFFQNKRLVFSDEIREESTEIIDILKNNGVAIALLSGDKKATVQKVANLLGIANYKYEQLPADKQNFINSTEEYSLMVGDGVNDSPALKAAFVSVSLADCSDLAKNTADVILGDDNLKQLIYLTEVAKKSVKTMKQNIGFSLLYNTVTIPLAFCGFVHPAIAAIAMSSSSIIVILNSLRNR